MTSSRGSSFLDYLRSVTPMEVLKWASAIFVVCLYVLSITVFVIQIVSHS